MGKMLSTHASGCCTQNCSLLYQLFILKREGVFHITCCQIPDGAWDPLHAEQIHQSLPNSGVRITMCTTKSLDELKKLELETEKTRSPMGSYQGSPGSNVLQKLLCRRALWAGLYESKCSFKKPGPKTFRAIQIIGRTVCFHTGFLVTKSCFWQPFPLCPNNLKYAMWPRGTRPFLWQGCSFETFPRGKFT